MADPRDRILVVDVEQAVVDRLADETLALAGFDVATATDGASALAQVTAFEPDVILVGVELGDFSGKDMLAALQAQGFEGPIIALVSRGAEQDALQAFRLGASDYLAKPIREAEAVSAVDRALKSVRARQERERLQQQLQRANDQLEQRVRELTTLFGIGKAVTDLSDVEALFGKLVEAATFVTGGELGWMLLADENTGDLILRAGHNLPPPIAKCLQQPWDDGLARLVVQSGEPLLVSGPGIQPLPIARLALAAVVVPVQIRDRVIGALVAARKAARTFTERDQAMLAAVADYASVAVVNLRLFQALEARARSLQNAYDKLSAGEAVKTDFLQNVSHELRTPISQAHWQIQAVLSGDIGEIGDQQRKALQDADAKLTRAAELIENMVSVSGDGWSGVDPERFLLVDVAREAMAARQRAAEECGVALTAGFPDRPLHVVADRVGVRKVFDNLLDNALKFGADGTEIHVGIVDNGNGSVQVEIADNGVGVPADQLEHIFERFVQGDGSTTRRHAGTGLGLALTREIVEALGGKVWAESEPGRGASFFFTLLKSDNE